MSFKMPDYKVTKKDDSAGMEFYAPGIIIAAIGIIAMLAPIVVTSNPQCEPGYHWDPSVGECVPN